MKKSLLVLVLVLSALVVVNAQTTTKTTKTTTKTETSKEQPKVIKVSDLPKAITDNLAKDYPDYAVKQATSLTANDVTSYHVVVMKDNTTKTLVYDSNGKLEKKLKSKDDEKK